MINPYEEKLPDFRNINKTEQKICNSFINLYQKQSFEVITIKEICRNAHIARTTFYNYFGNTWEVRSLIEDNFVAGLLHASYNLNNFDFEAPNYQSYLQSTLFFLERNRKIFKMFLVDHPSTSFIEKYKLSIKYHYFNCGRHSELDLEIIAGYLISIFTYVLKNSIPITMNEIDKYERLLKILIDNL